MGVHCKCCVAHGYERSLIFFNFQNKTRGLFGTWNWDMSDDFTLPDGTIVGANLNNFESAHRQFAMNCK